LRSDCEHTEQVELFTWVSNLEKKMPASLLMVAIDWYGPFKTLAAAKLRGEQSGVEDFLYLGYQIDPGEKSYVGISSDISGRLISAHHVLGTWQDEAFELWIGLVSSQSEPGRRPADSRPTAQFTTQVLFTSRST
jgi:hypothetical protein